MKLYMAGVNHFDPLGRRELIVWLLQLSRAERTQPAFIAVEWNHQLCEYLIAQRSAFRQALLDDDPELTSYELEWLTLSLAYEGDTPSEVFPGTNMIWLDDGRVIAPTEYSDYPIERRMKYQIYLDRHPTIRTTHDALVAMSVAATQDGSRTQLPNYERDRQWADLLSANITPITTWAIVVVGAAHTRHTGSTLRMILEQRGIDCQAKELVPKVVEQLGF